MGFFGLLLLARADRPLAELASVVALDGACPERVLAGGWRLGQVATREVPDLHELTGGLVEDTAAPALATYVVGGDFAEVACDSPGGARHTFLFNPDTALAVLGPWDDAPRPPTTAQTVPILERWAAEAGLPSDATRIADALPRRPVEAIAALVDAFGMAR